MAKESRQGRDTIILQSKTADKLMSLCLSAVLIKIKVCN